MHAAVHVSGADDEGPRYVLRDIDRPPIKGDGRVLRGYLEAGLSRSAFALLVGDSCVGKSRSLYEAVRELVPDWRLIRPGSTSEFEALAADPPEQTVVWADEFQNYLGDEHGISAATVRALLSSHRPVIVVGTLSSDLYRQYIKLVPADQDDFYRRQRELIDLAEVFHLFASFSAAEWDRARELASSDVRIRLVLQSRDDRYGPTQIMAAAPQLVARWENADSYARAVLTAAADSARLGARAPLPGGLLRQAAPAYCNAKARASAPPDWFETALAYATEPLLGTVGALDPEAGDGITMGSIEGYTVADYLLQHIARERRYAVPPRGLWDAFLTHISDPEDLANLAASAHTRLLLAQAEALYKSAPPDRHYFVASQLAQLLADQGRRQEAIEILRPHAARPSTAVQLADLLADEGQIEEAIAVLRPHSGAGNDESKERLIVLLAQTEHLSEAITLAAGSRDLIIDFHEPARILHQQGHIDQLSVLVEATGDYFAILELVQALSENGRVDEAITALQEWSGNMFVAAALPEFLAEWGQMDELRMLEAAGDENAAVGLAQLLAGQNRKEEAIEVLRGHADAGSARLVSTFATLLVEQDQQGEAITFFRKRIEAGHRDGVLLAELLARQGQPSEAVSVLRKQLEAGDEGCIGYLAELLVQQSQPADAVELLQRHVPRSGGFHGERLAELLAAHGPASELRARAEAGGRDAALQLTASLAGQGRVEEAAIMLETFCSAVEARRLIANALAEHGRPEEADRLWQLGLDPDGSIASSLLDIHHDR